MHPLYNKKRNTRHIHTLFIWIKNEGAIINMEYIKQQKVYKENVLAVENHIVEKFGYTVKADEKIVIVGEETIPFLPFMTGERLTIVKEKTVFENDTTEKKEIEATNKEDGKEKQKEEKKEEKENVKKEVKKETFLYLDGYELVGKEWKKTWQSMWKKHF